MSIGVCPECGGVMEMVGLEQGTQCDTCGFKYDALGNPDRSEMEKELEHEGLKEVDSFE